MNQEVIRLPRRNKERNPSEFAVVVEDISSIGDVYKLADSVAFTISLANGQTLITNISDTVPNAWDRMTSLRNKLQGMVNAEPVHGFEDLLP